MTKLALVGLFVPGAEQAQAQTQSSTRNVNIFYFLFFEKMKKRTVMAVFFPADPFASSIRPSTLVRL